MHPPMRPLRELTAADFRLNHEAGTTLSAKQAAQKVLQDSLAVQRLELIQESLSADASATLGQRWPVSIPHRRLPTKS